VVPKYPILGVLKIAILGGPENWAFCQDSNFPYIGKFVIYRKSPFSPYPKKRVYKNNYYL
jgi:hypothetical protein